LNNSPERCGAPPVPDDAKASAPGRLGERNHVGDGMRRQRRRDRHDQGKPRQQNDRRKILHGIVGQVRIEVGADAVGRYGVEEQRVAVGVGFGDARRRRRSARAAAIYDDNGLPERIGKLGADNARDEVGGAAWRHRDHKLDLTGRIGRLRACCIYPDKRHDNQ
jgi:hypothetical protein